MALFVVEVPRSPGYSTVILMRHAEVYDRVRRMMQGVTGHPFGLLAGLVRSTIQTRAAPQTGLGAGALFLEAGQGFRPTPLDGARTPTGNRQRIYPIRDHPEMSHADVQTGSLVGGGGHRFGNVPG